MSLVFFKYIVYIFGVIWCPLFLFFALRLLCTAYWTRDVLCWFCVPSTHLLVYVRWQAFVSGHINSLPKENPVP
jgi:hypothetical protein